MNYGKDNGGEFVVTVLLVVRKRRQTSCRMARTHPGKQALTLARTHDERCLEEDVIVIASFIKTHTQEVLVARMFDIHDTFAHTGDVRKWKNAAY